MRTESGPSHAHPYQPSLQTTRTLCGVGVHLNIYTHI